MKLPTNIALEIRRNDHAIMYQTIRAYLMDRMQQEAASLGHKHRHLNPVTNDLIAACEKSGEVWEIIWHPSTPVGSCNVFGATLEAALAAANES